MEDILDYLIQIPIDDIESDRWHYCKDFCLKHTGIYFHRFNLQSILSYAHICPKPVLHLVLNHLRIPFVFAICGFVYILCTIFVPLAVYFKIHKKMFEKNWSWSNKSQSNILYVWHWKSKLLMFHFSWSTKRNLISVYNNKYKIYVYL